MAGDTLILTKLDRFARSTAEAIEKGVEINVLSMGLVGYTLEHSLKF